jgi:hypothetical protein
MIIHAIGNKAEGGIGQGNGHVPVVLHRAFPRQFLEHIVMPHRRSSVLHPALNP